MPTGGGRIEVAIAAASLVAMTLLGIAITTAGGARPPSNGEGAKLLTTQVRGSTVITHSKGFTLYWFSPRQPV